ncbi:holo-ACP synthase [Anoxybacterium hadale]
MKCLVIGIGTDILHMETLDRRFLQTEDPFYQMTYTEEEQLQGACSNDPSAYFCLRFAGKEAVFKALNTSPDTVRRWNQIEILNRATGAPLVNLYGDVKNAAARAGIKNIHLSLSYDKEYAVAFCVTSE